MAHFIDTSRGLINLDHVLRIISSPKLGHSDLVYFTNGDNFECLLYGDKDLEGVVIPAVPDTIAIVFYKTAESQTEKPKDDQLWCEQEPIIGWRIQGDYSTPVFLQALSGNAVPFFQMPGKQYRELCYDGATYPNLEEARESVLTEAIQGWERNKQREAAKAGLVSS